MEIPDYLTCLLRNLDAGQEATVRTGMEQVTASKLGKEFNRAVYCYCLFNLYTESVSSISRVQLCIDPMDFSTPGFPVYHQLPEPIQTHVHYVRDAIQLSHPVNSFSSCLQSFPASGSFPMSQFFTSDGQSIGVPASASVLPMNIQDWFPLGWTGWISLQSKGLSRVFSNTIFQKHKFFSAQLSL